MEMSSEELTELMTERDYIMWLKGYLSGLIREGGSISRDHTEVMMQILNLAVKAGNKND